ncbi:MAG: glycoside hydrolase family 88 protein [Planctomycetaceae bacterium]|nr:glycoside hydrolase family 88 protein [Planctomycetaceae bacterium]
MKKITLLIAAAVIAGCAISKSKIAYAEGPGPAEIKSVMAKVADWQLANPSQRTTTDWTHGAYLAGLTAWAQMADDAKYLEAVKAFGEKNNWQPGKRVYHADDHAIGQMYLEMYKLYGEPKMIDPIHARFDEILANLSTMTLEKGKQQGKDRWWWCDALFMAPPVWMNMSRLTGEAKYFDFMNKEWWATTDYLYDKKERLYFRDDSYFDKRQKNGAKVFWSRGNGWVLAGLARVLEAMPADHAERPRYERLFKDMAAKLVAIQPEDGMWRPSLLDPASFPVPESSGSGFFCYGLAWGINHGLLEGDKYTAAVMKAWQGLNRNVQTNGKLGFVQPIGGDPQMTKAEDTEIYGVGAFLLAGSEVYKLAVRQGFDAMLVTMTNPITEFRNDETISVEWPKIDKSVKSLTKDDAAVFDFKTNKLLVNQTVDFEKPAALLYQTNLAPGEIKYFWVMKKPAMLEQPAPTRTTFCRFIPERKDDFGWENDKVAFRIYGPALEYETITAGIDAWGKSVPYPVIDKWIKDYNEKKIPYHYDHGEGGDFYKVGPTLGCGAMAPFVDGKVSITPHNFVEHKRLANGPIRSVFEVRYDPWQAGPLTVSEVKRYAIDLGSQMSRVECTYSGDMKEVPVAAGIVLRENSDKTWSDERAIAYWLPTDFITGNMGIGVVFGPQYKPEVLKADSHLLLKLTAKTGEPIAYYTGSCWDKNAGFSTFEKWQEYLKLYRTRLDNPVKVELK